MKSTFKNNNEKRDKAVEMFKNNRSNYAIQIETGLSFKEITYYISQDKEAKNRHKRLIAQRREEVA